MLRFCVYLLQVQISVIFSNVAPEMQKGFLLLLLLLLILLCLLNVHFKSGSPEADRENAPRRNWEGSGGDGEGSSPVQADLSDPAAGLWSRNYSSELVLTQARLLDAHTSK